jgi:hypothetical protein
MRMRFASRGLVLTALPAGGWLVGRLFDAFGATEDGVATDDTFLEGDELRSIEDLRALADRLGV